MSRTYKFKSPFDPDETKDYTVDWSLEMEATDDTIASATAVLSAEALADGLVIDDVAFTDTTSTAWLTVTDPETSRADLVGNIYELTYTITTASTPPRTLQLTVKLQVAEK